MEEPLFRYSPSFPSFIYKMLFLLPLLCIPAGVAVYFEEDSGGILQLLSIAVGVGMILPGLLYAMLKGVSKLMKMKSSLVITPQGELKAFLNQREVTLPLNSLTDIKMVKMWGLTNVQIKKANGETLNLPLPGQMTKQQDCEFQNAIAKFASK